MQIETKRLILREMTESDYGRLYEILSDPETMQHYPAPFSVEKVHAWIRRNQERYAREGYGLWAVILKETGELIGDCGVTMQMIHGKNLPEVGYHIHWAHRRRGYAAEAARASIDYIFSNTSFDAVYSYMKYTNEASYGVALKNGMRFVEEYEDPVNIRTRVYALTREEWNARHAEL